jgi:hypothetical protein
MCSLIDNSRLYTIFVRHKNIVADVGINTALHIELESQMQIVHLRELRKPRRETHFAGAGI